jgi:hypothetical protein
MPPDMLPPRYVPGGGYRYAQSLSAGAYRRHSDAIDRATREELAHARRRASLTVVATAGSAPLAGVSATEAVTVIIQGVRLAATLATLPEILAAVAVGVAVLIIIRGLGYRFPNKAGALRWSRQMAGAPAPPEHLPIADPLPPLPPSTARRPQAAAEGFTPGPTLPALPPTVTPPPVPPLPGHAPHAAGPVIMEHRNTGLPQGMTTSARRARANARNNSPGVVNQLAENEWHAHHLISIETIRKVPGLFAAAAQAGWSADGPGNVVALPNSARAQAKLTERQRLSAPYHDNGHWRWNDQVYQVAEGAYKRLNKKYGEGDSAVRSTAAREIVERLERQQRERLKHLGRVTNREERNDAAIV